MSLPRKLLLTATSALLAFTAIGIQAMAASAGPDDPPAPVDRQLFLRNDDDTDCVHIFLSDTDGPDAGNFCAYQAWAPKEVAGEFRDNYFIEEDTNRVKLPITIDASKPLTGTIAIGTVTPNNIQIDVIVTLGGTTLPAKHIDTGAYTGSTLLESAPTFPISIPIPAALDKTDINTATVSIVWGQELNVGGTVWLELDDPATSITIPAYDKSWVEFCATHTC